MANSTRGNRRWNWRGGRIVNRFGYWEVPDPSGEKWPSGAYKRALEHRLVASEMLGRPLRVDEVVHHVNGDKLDNSPSNLEVLPSRRHHNAKHRGVESENRRPDEPNPVVTCSCGCGATFERYDGRGRPRKFVCSAHSRWPRSRHGTS